ncbi:ATP-binding protein [Mycobacterium servetii]|uniref:ATP-binding protein n=1 Tax=Mycobacterium servetii TaxID=3237418 RepID=UPI00350EE253
MRHAEQSKVQLAGEIGHNEHVPAPVEWGTVVADPRLVAAIVDRITFNAHILETGTQSYRLRTSTTRPTKKTT